jgi:hypothetical protein
VLLWVCDQVGDKAGVEMSEAEARTVIEQLQQKEQA